MIHLHNSATGQIEELRPAVDGIIKMYVCGPTVYDVPHLGHGRFVLVYDILRRYLEYQGHGVIHVSNITDVDDKILARADSENRQPSQVAGEYEEVWWKVLDDLNVLRPTHVPHATAYIQEMITFISELIEIGAAYIGGDGVYFEVSRIESYGLLAHQSLESMRSGARVEPNPNKRSPIDFALWKNTPNAEWAWESPFGRGRPGWHTECVVMAQDLLGSSFDIHGGGADLAFPHHENERAQALALGSSFADKWVHNGFIVVGDEKMSKSLSNFVTLPELIGEDDPRAFRLLVLQSHYRSPLEVNSTLIGDAARALERIDNALVRFDRHYDASISHVQADSEILESFGQAMDNDMDTPLAISILFQGITSMNVSFDNGDLTKAIAIAKAIEIVVRVFGLGVSRSELVLPDAVVELFREREGARQRKDFAASDRLRDRLLELGYGIEDTKEGGQIRKL